MRGWLKQLFLGQSFVAIALSGLAVRVYVYVYVYVCACVLVLPGLFDPTHGVLAHTHTHRSFIRSQTL